ncbi:transketolase [Petrocella atlantisensis]|uniref:Transketolase n=1 Tax=Petrocella atlantisensis TaxID=2173034 RepID=A0A3P7RVS3_9FIRM|nr:transketolase [Petrocella atlantisensis]VDN46876.1 transketolase [Petrocella atlantisensis]
MKEIDTLSINSIRILSAEAVQKANSGHPGLPMGAAPMAYELWANHMNHNGKDPSWVNRDRFVLSAGHGSMLLYSLLHLFDYGLTIEDIKSFRQWDSKTPGHPEFGHTVGVETTTGPLGAGFTNAVGMAMAEANLAARFNKDQMDIIDHYTYTIVGDGCLMEGITSEAASLAGTLKLGKLITLYDSNSITIEGSTDLAFTEDVGARFKAYHWEVLEVENGNDPVAIGFAIEKAKKNLTQPSLIIVKTLIGHGCPAKEGKHSAHGEPLGDDNIVETKKNLGWTESESFTVPKEVYEHMASVNNKGVLAQEAWQNKYEAYKEKYPELALELGNQLKNEQDLSALDDDAFWTFDEKSNATRSISGEVIQRLVKIIPNLFGGAADLAPSTKTYMNGQGDFSADQYEGMNIHFGVRELAMAGIGNGISIHGGFKAFVSSFFVFSDYMKPMARLSAIMHQPLTYVLTHDSIGVGEDGPTHQPVEQLTMLRTIPNFTTFRPADAKEVAAAWYYAVTNKHTPTAIVLTRQNVPYYQETGKEALKGGYILSDSDKSTPDLILLSSGSEVEYVYEAAKKLRSEGMDVRVVSMPAMNLFDAQSEAYKEAVLPKECRRRIAIEAGATAIWYKYVGLDGKVLGIDKFGASAPGSKVYEAYGITTEAVYNAAKDL